MFNIGNFLEKFKSVGLKETERKRAVVEAVEQVLKHRLSEKEVDVRNQVAFIEGHPALKNQIYIKKDSLLELLSKKTSGIKDIK